MDPQNPFEKPRFSPCSRPPKRFLNTPFDRAHCSASWATVSAWILYHLFDKTLSIHRKGLCRGTLVESSEHEFRSNPIGNTTGFSRKYLNCDAIWSEPVGSRRNTRCWKLIGFRRKRWDPTQTTIAIENGAQLSLVTPNHSIFGWGISLTVSKPRQSAVSITNE
jgi:hypothetical protein